MSSVQKMKPKASDNESGLTPIGWRVVIKPDKAQDTMTAPGGKTQFYLPPSKVERAGYGMDRGTIIALGGMAFKDREGVAWTGAVPGVGDRVFFPRYGGMEYEGHGGQIYRVINDEEIPAAIDG